MAVIRKQTAAGATWLRGRDIIARWAASPYVSRYFLVSLLVIYGLYFTLIASSTNLEDQPRKSRMPSNEEILKKLKPYDIQYVDVAGGPDIKRRKAHHRGAQNEHGVFGYSPDPGALRLAPPGFNLTGDALVEACNIRDYEYKMIREKITVQPEQGIPKHDTTILCVVQTVGHRHDSRISALRHTWAPNCDGFIVASNETDPSLGTVRIPHKDDNDLSKQKWSRLITVWSFIYDNYYKEYDWFFISNNDVVFLLVENLRRYLESDEIKAAANYGIKDIRQSKYQVPLFLGKRVAYNGNNGDIFNAAGPGYVVNKAALKLFVVEGTQKIPKERTSKEDVMIARVLRRLGVLPYDTQDETGGELFMVSTPGKHYANETAPMHHWEHHSKQSANVRYGVEHCAAKSISFHYVQTALMYRLYALFYKKCLS